ncbi:phosphopentomutase [Aliikangiella marina]|uniref:Phosphopentomutase n=1 Tax=Aliikangiella marina TaxID=1712262 RepID=A0A545THL6_9GAMM|nr:phosphopentomutase [Aliikangiella marina]TQV76724.1 phosphopentomutase [Aliikangiella marina]
MPRAIILVLDSLGIGAAPDAEKFGDTGSNTLGSIASWCASNTDDAIRSDGALSIPNLMSLGLGEANFVASGIKPDVAKWNEKIVANYAACAEVSTGKDTPSGHWEITGVPVRFDWGYFFDKTNSFPPAFIRAFKQRCGIKDILGNCHSSGTEIINRFGEEHIKTGYPICYTSADSVFQIAAHEVHFGLERLYEICEVARELLNEFNIGRVIARPFVGEAGEFTRTGNRKDYTTPPHEETLLDKLVADGREVHSVGKIADIFAHRGVTHKTKVSGHDSLFDTTIAALNSAKDGSLIFTNFVEFDQSFGHRRDVAGYASALEHFDQRLPEIIDAMKADDLLILTADHGCDPTWHGSDHTREYVPFLAYIPNQDSAKNYGVRQSFCDIGQSIADYLEISPLAEGVSIFGE